MAAIWTFSQEDAYNKVDVGFLAYKLHKVYTNQNLVHTGTTVHQQMSNADSFGKWKSSTFPVSSGSPH